LQKTVTDDLDALMKVLPSHLVEPLARHEDYRDLLEIVLDLGRLPEARFPQTELVLSNREVTAEDIQVVLSQISSFGDDNRAGIERTLHRISAIRNRQGRVIGLTCRVGRAVFGTIRIIKDLVESGKSILLLGRPGIGKTTMLRETARVLADDLARRVVIVDTSNEIAGDGDIPHPAIGHARRMQVPTPTMQHAVMIEAVENHMPEIIVIDEIGTELEAAAARTIAERGVQLIATAHGNTLDNLMMNPTLSDLVGGIQSVTLGDEEARRRGTQKSVLERKAPPTFDIVVEIRERNRVAIHPDVSEAADSILQGQLLIPELRWLDEDGEVRSEKVESPSFSRKTDSREPPPLVDRAARVYPFGINRGRLEQAAEEMQAPLEIAESMREADLLVTSKKYYRTRPQKIREAENTGLPIYVLRSNTPPQMKQFVSGLHPRDRADMVRTAIQEAEAAVADLEQGAPSVTLNPQPAHVRRLQHLLAERHHLTSRSSGRDPQRRVVLSRETRDGRNNV
jgi:stage III sporulation protein SpoIIIAA